MTFALHYIRNQILCALNVHDEIDASSLPHHYQRSEADKLHEICSIEWGSLVFLMDVVPLLLATKSEVNRRELRTECVGHLSCKRRSREHP